MSVAKMDSKQPSILAAVFMVLAVLSACVDAERSTAKEQGEMASTGTASQGTTDLASSKKRARLQLGDAAYELGIVFCMGTTTATITANDSQRRADHPVVSVKIYDPAMTGGQSHDTVSAYFERDGYGENWALEEGSVERDGDTVTASGTLKGHRLVPREDGTRESAPLEGDSSRPFELRIEC